MLGGKYDDYNFCGLAAVIRCIFYHSQQAFSTMRVMDMSMLGGITW